MVPKVQDSYRANGYKLLMGQSNTGLYATYNMLYHPYLFDAYIVSSPIYGWHTEYYFENKKAILDTEYTRAKNMLERLNKM